MSGPVTMMRLLAMVSALVVAPVFAAPVEISAPVCPLLFLPPGAQDLALPYETRFKGPRSETRFYRDGTVWEHIEGKWVVIGSGTIVDNKVILERGLPDLRPLNQFEYSRTILNERRYFPNFEASYTSKIHQLKISTHTIEIIVPETNGLDGIADGIIRTIASLPVKRIETIKTVRVNTRPNKNDAYWQKTYKNFSQSAATAGKDGEIDLYGVTLPNFRNSNLEALRITRHEFGHLIAKKVFGNPAPDRFYTDIASRDLTTVSVYGNNSWAEDFAEGIEVYLRSNAGQFAPEFRRRLRGRFAFFDDVFSYRKPQSVTEEPVVESVGDGHGDEVFVTLIAGERLLVLSPARGLGIIVD